MRKWILCTLTPFLGSLAFASPQPSFEVRLGDDGQTLGDMRPVFIDVSAKRLPDIPLAEVIRRYKRLFDAAEEPSVRIDALHRLIQLQDVAGERLELTIEEENQLYARAIDSYNRLIDGRHPGFEPDELLYHAARAHAFVGEEDASARRLEELVSRHPQSSYLAEARFRLGERLFNRQDYAGAERHYRAVLDAQEPAALVDRARYMLGWTQFKARQTDLAGRTFLEVLDRYYDADKGFTALEVLDKDTVDDTLRVLSLVAASAGGASAFDRLLSQSGGRPYELQLYEFLADYYLEQERYADSTATLQSALRRTAEPSRAAALQIRLVAVHQQAGDEAAVLEQKAAYVQRYAHPEALAALSRESKAGEALQQYIDDLGEWHYRRAQGAQGEARRVAFEKAAGYLQYYQALYLKQPEAGERLLLAGDAWKEAGDREAALQAYEAAAYQAPDFERAGDAGYAVVLLRREHWDSDGGDAALASLSVESARFSRQFPADVRTPRVQVAMANLLMAQKQLPQAAQFAADVLAGGQADAESQQAARLVLANAAFEGQSFGEAEKYYREASLGLTAQASAGQQIQEKIAAAIYRQAEAAEQAGDFTQAVTHYQRIEGVPNDSPIRVSARFDGANVLLKSERWVEAIDALLAFRRDYPAHELTANVPEKLVAAYQAAGQPAQAAQELDTWVSNDRNLDAQTRWTRRLAAAELWQRAGEREKAFEIYRAYLQQASSPDSAEQHQRLQALRHTLARESVLAEEQSRWRAALVDAEVSAAYATEQTRRWAGEAALQDAESAGQAFLAIPIRQPLAASIASKRKALEAAVSRYKQAQALGGDAVQAQSAWALAELYRALARDLMQSERPSGLDEMQLEQYDVLLEEQAFPFEEQAIVLHVSNQQRLTRLDTLDPWVQKSLQALAEMFPARYARTLRRME